LDALYFASPYRAAMSVNGNVLAVAATL